MKGQHVNSGIYTPYGHLTDEELLREAYFTDKTLTPLELELLKRLEEHIQVEDRNTTSMSLMQRSRVTETVE